MKSNLIAGLLLVGSGLILGSVQAQTLALGSSVQRIKSEGVVRIAVRDRSPPFAYYEDGKPKGFTWDLCQAVVKDLEVEFKKKIEIKAIPADLKKSFELLNSGEVDMQCGATTHTVEREQQVNFSVNFFISGIATAYRKNDLAYANPLNFGRVIVLENSSAQKVIDKRFATKGSLNIQAVIPVKTYAEGIEKLKKNEADTFFADSVLMPLDAAVDRRRALDTIEPYSLMLRKGDSELTALVDRSLIKIFKSNLLKNFITDAKMDGKINNLTLDSWKNPSKEAYPSMY